MKLRDFDLPKNADAALDAAIEAAASAELPPEVEHAAAARVRERLAREATPEVHGPAMAPGTPEIVAGAHLAACADFQALIPAYLQGALTPAKALLLEDHSRECLTCRRALKAARTGAAELAVRRPAANVTGWQRSPWLAVAAAVLLTVGIAGVVRWGDFLGNNTAIAQVAAVDGQLFRLVGDEPRPLAPGEAIAEGQEVRTGKDSGAVVRLADGSRIEMRERSALSLAERGGDTTIRVARGGIIVEAAEQHGHLYVATEDCLVSVTGTIFSVNHGTKGSRVAVIEGEVHVEHGDDERVLHPGDQAATREGGTAASVETEFSWSRDRERYIALLSELKALDRDVSRALAATGLRYDSRLLPLVPADTAIYLGLPNVTTELADAYHLFEQRLAANEVLAEWWRQQVGGSGTDREIAEMIDRLAGLGQHLGEEIVIALDLDEDSEPHAPLLLAEVANPASFAAVLASEVERLNADPGHEVTLRIVADPATAAPAGEHELLLWPAGDLFAATPDLAALQALAARLASPGAAGFAETAFASRLVEAYSQGAQWLGGVDLASLLDRAEDETSAHGAHGQQALAFTGLDHVEHVIVEHKANGEVAHTGGVLYSDGPRTGALAWLAAPAAMGSLDFVSPDANFAAAFVVEDPATILGQTFRFVEGVSPGFADHLAAFEREHGVDVVDDLAAPLGGEIAFAIDGPSLPLPAWKVVAEVYDTARLQQAIEWATAEIDRLAAAAGKPGVTLGQETANGRTYYRISSPNVLIEVHYTFDGGYFIAAPSRALVDRALAVRDSQYSLPDAPGFKALLPTDGYLDFSAVVYGNLGPLGSQMLAMVQPGLTPDQQQAVADLDLGAPFLTCAYGESERIRLVSTAQGGLLGSRLAGFLGLGTLLGGARNPAEAATVGQ